VGQANRFQTLSDLGEDQSVDIRKRQVQEALSQFSSSPLFGVGLGHQYFYHIEYTSKYEGATNYNHSDIANTLCKMGLIGTLAVYTLLIMAVMLSGRLRRQGIDDKDRWFGAMAQIALIAALIMGNSCPVLQERGATFLVGLLIGLVVAIAASNDRVAKANLEGYTAEACPTENVTSRFGMVAHDR
jgi:O-antigen ligase